MGGGLIQLVAYGAQDLYLTGNPQITFFKAVFRRHCNFSLESIEQDWNGNISAGGKIAVTLGRQGDLVSQIFIKTNGIVDDTFSVIHRVDCEIGGQIIDSHLSHWMNIWCDLTHNMDKAKQLDGLRSGSKRITTISQGDLKWPLLESLDTNHVGTYPGTTGFNMIDIVNDSIGNSYFIKTGSVSYNGGYNSYICKITRNNIGTENYTEAINNTFAVTHAHNSVQSGHSKIVIYNNKLYVTRTDGILCSVSLSNTGQNLAVVESLFDVNIPAGYIFSNGIVPSYSNGNHIRGNYINGISAISKGNNCLYLAQESSPFLITKMVFDPNYTHQLEKSLVYDPPQFTNGWGGGPNLGNLIGGDIGDSNIQVNGPWNPGINYDKTLIIVGFASSELGKIDLTQPNKPLSKLTGVSLPSQAIVIAGYKNSNKALIYYLDNTMAILDIDGNNGTGSVTNLIINSSTIPGWGSGSDGPDMVVDSTDTYAYLTVQSTGHIVKLTIATGVLDIITGGHSLAPSNGTSIDTSTWRLPRGISYFKDSTNEVLYVGDFNKLRKIDLINDSVSYLGNVNISILEGNVEVNNAGTKILYHPKWGRKLYIVDAITGEFTQILPHDGSPDQKPFGSGHLVNSINNVKGFMFLPDDKSVIVTDNSDHSIRILTFETTVTSTYNPGYYLEQCGISDSKITNILSDSQDNLYVSKDGTPGIFKISYPGSVTGTSLNIMNQSNIITNPTDIAMDNDSNIIVSCSQTHSVYRHTDASGQFTRIAGTGSAGTNDSSNPLLAEFSSPSGLAMNSHNDIIVGQTGATGSMKVIGGIKPYDIVTNTNIPEYGYIPLQFWFCRNPGLALPLIALQYHEVKLIIELADSLNGVNEMEVWADYIFLDTDERRRFAQTSHEYLIEQVQHSNTQTIGIVNITDSSSKKLQSLTELRFNHPVKELLWTVYQEADGANSLTKACSVINQGGSQNIEVTSALLQMNGSDRFKERDGKYHTRVQRYQKHTGVGIGITRRGVGSDDLSSADVTSKWYPRTMNTHMYSFALNPEEYQPSSTCNFSRIDNAVLGLKFNTPPINSKYTYKLDVYGINYNVLRITSGMGGLAYSN